MHRNFHYHKVNSLRPRQNGRLFADDTFKRIFLKENITISTKNSLKCVPKGLINNIPALDLIMAWCRPGDKPLSEPMLVRSLTHICVTRPQWVNTVLTFIMGSMDLARRYYLYETVPVVFFVCFFIYAPLRLAFTSQVEWVAMTKYTKVTHFANHNPSIIKFYA